MGYDLVLFGPVEPHPKINVDAVEARLRAPENAVITRIVREIGINSAVDLFRTYAGSVSDMGPWLADAQSIPIATCVCSTWPASA